MNQQFGKNKAATLHPNCSLRSQLQAAANVSCSLRQMKTIKKEGCMKGLWFLFVCVFVIFLALSNQGFAVTDEQLGNKADAIEKKQSKSEGKSNDKSNDKNDKKDEGSKADNYKVDVSGQDTKNYPASDWKK